MSNNIPEALAQLDTTNDEQWTSEGLPRLDVMSKLVGNPVSRADVTSAAKGFTRTNSKLEVLAPTPVVAVPAESEAEAIVAESAESAESEDTSEDLTEDEVVEAALVEAQANLVEAQKQVRKAQENMDVVITRRAKEDAGVTDAHRIKEYQRSQQAQRAIQAKQRNLMTQAALSTPNNV